MKKALVTTMVLVLVISAFFGCAPAAPSASEAPAAASTPAAAPSAPAAPAASNDKFILGVISPLSGSGAASGAVQANAVKLAVDEINAAGGINGQIPITMISEDDEGTPAVSVTVTQKLVEQDKVHAIIGALNSSCTLADMEITTAAGIPQITPSSSNVSITQQGSSFIFRMTATDATHAKTLLKYASQTLGAKTCGMIYESSDFGAGAYKIVSGLVADYGLQMVANEVYNSGDTDFSVQLTKLQSAKPDVIILWGYYTEAAMICTQKQQYGIDIPLIGTGYNSPALVELGGAAVDGLIFTTAFDAANPDPTVQAFDQKYKQLFSGSYDQNAPQSYDAVYVLADAVTRCMAEGADWKDGATLSKYIRETVHNGATGTTSFDETGEMIKDLMVIRIESGEHKIVNW